MLTKNDRLRIKLLSKEKLDEIHYGTLDVLESVGLKVYEQDARDILAEHGCRVDNEKQIVKFPPYIVEDAIHDCPKQFMMYGQDPKYDYLMNGMDYDFTGASMGEAIFVRDPYTGTKHPSTKKDAADVARLVDALDDLKVNNRALCIAPSVPGEVYQIHIIEAMLNNTRKHVCIGTDSGYSVEMIIRMGAAVAGGMDKLRERPILNVGSCSVSPLILSGATTGPIIAAAKAGIPFKLTPCPGAGSTGPMTIAGTIIVANAEFLGGLVLGQAIRRGTPMVYGAACGTTNMGIGTYAVGTAELTLMCVAQTELTKYYGIPSYIESG